MRSLLFLQSYYRIFKALCAHSKCVPARRYTDTFIIEEMIFLVIFRRYIGSENLIFVHFLVACKLPAKSLIFLSRYFMLEFLSHRLQKYVLIERKLISLGHFMNKIHGTSEAAKLCELYFSISYARHPSYSFALFSKQYLYLPTVEINFDAINHLFIYVNKTCIREEHFRVFERKILNCAVAIEGRQLCKQDLELFIFTNKFLSAQLSFSVALLKIENAVFQ